jgi:hypothetical protein
VRAHRDFEGCGVELIVTGVLGQVGRVLAVTGLIDDELVVVQ